MINRNMTAAARLLPTFFFACLLAILLGLALSGCAALEPAPQAYAMSTPFASPPAAPAGQPLPRPPTATAVVFEMLPTGTPLPTRTPIPPVPTFSLAAHGPENFPPEVNPLTGLAVSDPGHLERRPAAIKVTNYPRGVRPQWGLSAADHVWEYYIGDGMTRFVAIYYGNDAGRVGPVRSARFFDEYLVRLYKANFVFGSADERVLNPWLESDLKSFLVIERPNNCPPLCRIGAKNNYNTLFVDTELLSRYISARGTNNDRQDLDGLRFEAAVPSARLPGEHLAVRYSLVSFNEWRYDPESRRYQRFQETQDESQGGPDTAPLLDRLTGAQLASDNLVVLLVPHAYYVNTRSTEMITINLAGQGEGYAFRDGQVYPITWQRTAADGALSLALLSGRRYPLKPGTTWFQVLGVSSIQTQPDEGAWQFEFSIP